MLEMWGSLLVFFQPYFCSRVVFLCIFHSCLVLVPFTGWSLHLNHFYENFLAIVSIAFLSSSTKRFRKCSQDTPTFQILLINKRSFISSAISHIWFCHFHLARSAIKNVCWIMCSVIVSLLLWVYTIFAKTLQYIDWCCEPQLISHNSPWISKRYIVSSDMVIWCFI